jgi:hypothetical protein
VLKLCTKDQPQSLHHFGVILRKVAAGDIRVRRVARIAQYQASLLPIPLLKCLGQGGVTAVLRKAFFGPAPEQELNHILVCAHHGQIERCAFSADSIGICPRS